MNSKFADTFGKRRARSRDGALQDVQEKLNVFMTVHLQIVEEQRSQYTGPVSTNQTTGCYSAFGTSGACVRWFNVGHDDSQEFAGKPGCNSCHG